MAFTWDQPTLMICHRPLALFLAWNDESGEIMYMNSDKLEWAWDRVELVGSTIVEGCAALGELTPTEILQLVSSL